MHRSAYDRMQALATEFAERRSDFTVVDFGSQVVSEKQQLSHRALFEGCRYIGVDITPGPNVDIVMPKPYQIPLPSRSADLIVSGQVFEHIPFPWISMLELARVMKPKARMIITAPSRGHRHSKLDCWRYYPDGFKALAAFSGLKLISATTDFPPRYPDTKRLDYAKITKDHYWGDSVAVFQRPKRFPAFRVAAVRFLLQWWANGRDLSGSHQAR